MSLCGKTLLLFCLSSLTLVISNNANADCAAEAVSFCERVDTSDFSKCVSNQKKVTGCHGGEGHLDTITISEGNGQAQLPAEPQPSSNVYQINDYCNQKHGRGTSEYITCRDHYMNLTSEPAPSAAVVAGEPNDPCDENQVNAYCDANALSFDNSGNALSGLNACSSEFQKACKQQKKLAEGPTCQELSDKAHACCNGDKACLLGNDPSGDMRSGYTMMQTLTMQASAPGALNSMKTTCEIQRGASAASVLLNTTAAGICGRARNNCQAKCTYDINNGSFSEKRRAETYLSQCKRLKLNFAQLAMQVGSSSINLLTSNRCLKDVKNQEDAFNTATTPPPGQVNCSDPAQASNPVCQLCSGPNAVNNPNCQNLNNGNNGSLLNRSRDSNLSAGVDGDSIDDLLGAEALPDGPIAPQSNSASSGGGGGGGGGFGGGGGAFGGAAAGGEGGAGDAASKASGLTPGYSAQTGYSSGGGSYGYAGGGASGSGKYKGYGAGKDSKFNLNKFLPNGGKNKLGKRGTLNRGLAAVPGIAATHGSIWKQITKRYQAVCVRKGLMCGK